MESTREAVKSEAKFNLDQEKFVNEFDSKILIQSLCNRNYLWKINCESEEFPITRIESLNKMTSRFIIKFLSITRGDTKELYSLCKEFFESLTKLIRNLRINTEEYLRLFEGHFNDFHSLITELQATKTTEIIGAIKKSFSFKAKHKRPIISDLDLMTEEYKFTQKMFETTTFSTQYVFENYLGFLKCFIMNYSEIAEKAIEQTITRAVEDFNYKFDKKLTETKTKIQLLIDSILKNVKPMRLSVLMLEIQEESKEEVKQKWEIVYEDFLDQEQIELKQIVCLSETHNLITIGFKKLNELIIVSNNNYITRKIEETLPDENIVIASGSTEISLIYVNNSKRTGHLACFSDSKIINRKLLPIFYEEFSEDIKEIAYVRGTNELFYIDKSGKYNQFALEQNKPLTSCGQVVPTRYRALGISRCERYLILLSDDEAYLFSYDLQLMYMDHSHPYFAGVRSQKFELFYLQNSEDFNVKSVKIDSENMLNNPEIKIMKHQVDSIMRQTFSLARKLLDGTFQTKTFSDINATRVVPK